MPKQSALLGNTILLLPQARFLLGWTLLFLTLCWAVPWSEGWRSDNLLLLFLLTAPPLVARFSPNLFGAEVAVVLFVTCGVVLCCFFHFRPFLVDHYITAMMLVVFALMVSMVLRAVFGIISRLSLWGFALWLFWGFLGLLWLDFYLQDLRHAQYKVILGVFPVGVAGFILLRSLGRRVGELWVWAALGLLSLVLSLFYGASSEHQLLALIDVQTLQRLMTYLVITSLVFLVVICVALCLIEDTARLVRDLHCGALFSLAPLVVLLIWRDHHSGCFGMGRAFRDTLFYTSTLLLFMGPSLLERSLWIPRNDTCPTPTR